MNITLIYREGCHLCDDFEVELAAFCRQKALDYQKQDVDGDYELYRLYNELVPVLLINDKMVNHYFFDQEQVLASLDPA